ncbi:MAG: hydroxyacid dehydrogenase [Chitinophagaceae bacterium]|nr:MAG: hydroxyacid dehydrogenase [Chitinophagaceae bacterium]
MRPKVIVTAYAHPLLRKRLESYGFDVHEEYSIDYAGLMNIIGEYTGMIVTTKLKIDKAILDKAVSLKWIGRLGSGMELIDLDYASSLGIKCVASPEGNRNAVAEHSLGILLSLMHKISLANEQIKQFVWLRDENRGTELKGKKVGIIGYGNTGIRFAQLLSVFDASILVYDKYKTGFSEGCVQEVSLDEIMNHADVISFHVPLTAETHYFANQAFFKKCKKSPYFLNLSRGKVVNTIDLMAALDEGLICAAGLDVLENENIKSYGSSDLAMLTNLTQRPNVIITPHIGGYSYEALEKMANVVLEKLDLPPRD